MNRKLFIYNNARPHVHDSMDPYINTVPLSKEGIKKHFKVVNNPMEADYFYMGQIPNETVHLLNTHSFSYLKQYPHRHICDFEGEGGMPIPSWLHNSIITANGPLKKYSNIERLFTRPTFSHLLLNIIKNEDQSFTLPEEKSFGFRGYLNHLMRAMTVHALHSSEFKKDLHINRVWHGPSEVGGSVQQEYIDTMHNNLISLCPRGSGIDSVRLIETCYYNRVPVLISDHDYYLVGEDKEDLSFVYRIVGSDLTPDKIKDELQAIHNTPIDELYDRANAAREYFDKVIRKYFSDPTEYFIKWLDSKNSS